MSVRPLQVVLAAQTASESLASVVVSLGNAEVAVTCTTPAELLRAGSCLAPDVAIIHADAFGDGSLLEELALRSPETRVIAIADPGEGAAEGLVDALAQGAVGALYNDDGLFAGLERALFSSSTKFPVVADEATGLLLDAHIDELRLKRQRDVATIEALAAAVEARDFGTGRHQGRAATLAISCLERIDPDLAENEEVRYGFLLHDVGKIGVSDTILTKPGPLARDEWTLMRRHPEMGVKIVQPIGFSSVTTDIILRHHERMDGSGYPGGLSGDDIPLAARAFSVVDAYDAMISHRPYRAAMSKEEAVATIRRETGLSFEREIVDVFLDILD
jgi:putative nucleotidyltransferase with HDIG domain